MQGKRTQAKHFGFISPRPTDLLSTHPKSTRGHPCRMGHQQENSPAVYCCLINNKKLTISAMILLHQVCTATSLAQKVKRRKETGCQCPVKRSTAPNSPLQTHTKHSEAEILTQGWQTASLQSNYHCWPSLAPCTCSEDVPRTQTSADPPQYNVGGTGTSTARSLLTYRVISSIFNPVYVWNWHHILR